MKDKNHPAVVKEASWSKIMSSIFPLGMSEREKSMLSHFKKIFDSAYDNGYSNGHRSGYVEGGFNSIAD